MKKLISAIALVLITVACSAPVDSTPADTYTRICKDKDGKVVENSKCESSQASSGDFASSPFLWWYIGSQMASQHPVGSYVSPGVGQAFAPAISSTNSTVVSPSRPSTSSFRSTTSSPSSVSRPSTFRPSTSGGFRSSGGSFRSSGGGFRGR